MYLIDVIYIKKAKSKALAKEFDTDSYEEAIVQLERYLAKKKITEQQIVSYKVTKIITCGDCQATIRLDKSVNLCKCGASYDFMGNRLETAKT